MYTELYLSVEIRDDPVAVEVLKYLSGPEKFSYGGDLDMTGPRELPDHEFFFCDRWPQVLTSSSYYFTPKAQCDFWFDEISKSWFLVTRFDLKNYDDEIEMFLSWIKPYIREPVCQGGFLGYWLYEEDDEPHLIRYEEIE